ncbi:aldehyde dehydrogenase family protein [Paraferrimonas sedimenticola]|uniref:Aldehyde dehydrogenase n=1 Tax=Paraferrimonas sedimenticola TaxID=375674 RepID=A0AA37RWA7_9GAMM|nr:aldehyde dehydrogenase family protein [Paraferrimonas sedimenticola]GLP96376.1 aldehyde dehydrogenase [Paraferrimonas sedimenticola]
MAVSSQCYLAGEWQAPHSSLEIDLCDASTGVAFAKGAASSPEQIETAIDAAYQCFESGAWSELSPTQRADYLDKVALALHDQVEAIADADAMQTGVIIGLTQLFAKVCGAAFSEAAAMLRNLPSEYSFLENNHTVLKQRLPLGVAGIIAPWNAPSGIACHKLACALAAGCTVVYKPSEWAALSSHYIAKAIDAAGLPKGAFNMVLGDGACGAQVVSDPRVAAVSFTGGAKGGEAVGRACGEQIKPVQLELGGNNPMVILDSADIDEAADAVVAGLVTMNAQWCRALGRLVVANSVKTPLLSAIKSRLQHIKVGDARDPESKMGAMVHKGHYELVKSQIEAYRELGGSVLQVTQVPESEGYYLPPTLIDGLEGRQTLEEIFGPVATVHGFDELDEAVMLANQTPYGLAAYVYGESEQAWQVAAKIRSGVVKINQISIFNFSPKLPRPAWGKSGLGDEGGKETFEFFRGYRVIGERA